MNLVTKESKLVSVAIKKSSISMSKRHISESVGIFSLSLTHKDRLREFATKSMSEAAFAYHDHNAYYCQSEVLFETRFNTLSGL